MGEHQIRNKARLNRETNEEFMSRIMSYGCPTGALVQPFVLEGLRVYCEMFLLHGKQDWPEHGLISYDAWEATAKWLKEELEKKHDQVRTEGQ